MKKSLFLFATAILTINYCLAQSNWPIYKIDSKLSVKLPAPPDRKDENNMVSSVEDSSVYFITIINLGDDTTKVAGIVNKPGFADGLKSAMADKTPGFTVGEMKRNSWKGYTTFKTEGLNTTTHLKLYFSMLAIGGKLYFLGNIIPDGNNTTIDFLDLLILN